ncbi:MAG: translesion error-prone DNA polymerase V autoproteolytic subunit [Burkholderiales bacterium]|nr:translesion error-prone DNA polymerase V autoproteolytic subunit [Burkholderiales bacterium]
MKIYSINNETNVNIALSNATIKAGFPSPAAEYQDEFLNLNNLLIKNKEATFLVKVSGNSMIDANIHEGDILIVDKSLDATHGKIIIAVVDGDFTVKILYHKNNILKLIPANPEYPEIILKNEQELNIWGVVTYIIHKT